MALITVGIIGAGWPGAAHARGYLAAGGFKLVAVADLIPQRRKHMMAEFAIASEFAQAEELIEKADVEAISVCLPTHLHLPVVNAAMGAGKHVICESPPALNAKEARRMAKIALRYKRVLLYALQRRFGGNEQAAKAAITKGYAGEIYHVRSAWTRTRAIPAGTGWYTDRSKSGGGVMMDLGLPMLDLAWNLLDQPALRSAAAVSHRRFASLAPEGATCDVEDEISALLRFDGGKTMELTAAWAINQPPQQNGALCRAYGDKAAIEVYTGKEAAIYRDFQPSGQAKELSLKPPKTTQHTALMRHFRQCIGGQDKPEVGAEHGAALMEMVDAIYRSVGKGKSVQVTPKGHRAAKALPGSALPAA